MREILHAEVTAQQYSLFPKWFELKPRSQKLNWPDPRFEANAVASACLVLIKSNS